MGSASDGRSSTPCAFSIAGQSRPCASSAGARPSDPGSFCAALLGPLEYALPTDVDAATWRVALQHFAQRRAAEGEFRRLLERGDGQGRAVSEMQGRASRPSCCARGSATA